MRTRAETCCFTGHRPGKLPWGLNEEDPRCLELKRRLGDVVETAWEMGKRHFLCGMAMGCDLYFGEAVVELRRRHPEVTLEAAVPCPGQADNWGRELRERYARLLEACDLETLVQNRYSPSCMQRRDRYMVDRSSLLIAVYNGTPGGTRYTVQYAMSQGIDIVDLSPLEEL